MKKGKIMSMIVPIIFVIIPQIIVIIASSFMKNNQSIILNIGGSIGIICGLLALILIYQNKINVTGHIISILIVILISLIITCLSFFALSFIVIIFGAIISTVVSNMFLLFKCDPKSLRESVILMLINPINYALLDGIACILAVIMFPLNIVI